MKTKVSRVTQKGQVVIPMKLRKKLGIRKGTAVAFLEEDDRLILQPLTKEYIARLRGMLKGEPSPLKTLLRERKRERYS
jgi:AbrB family looped-hinge helix DNA binding protein